MYKFIGILVAAFILHSCATTETYKYIKSLKTGNIGFLSIKQDTIADNVYEKVNTTLITVVPGSFKENGIKSVRHIYRSQISADSLKKGSLKDQITQICSENNLDALIIPKVRFFEMDYNVNLMTLRVNIYPDGATVTEIELNTYNKNGEFLMTSSYNTKEVRLEHAIYKAVNKQVDKILQRRY